MSKTAGDGWLTLMCITTKHSKTGRCDTLKSPSTILYLCRCTTGLGQSPSPPQRVCYSSSRTTLYPFNRSQLDRDCARVRSPRTGDSRPCICHRGPAPKPHLAVRHSPHPLTQRIITIITIIACKHNTLGRQTRQTLIHLSPRPRPHLRPNGAAGAFTFNKIRTRSSTIVLILPTQSKTHGRFRSQSTF